MAGSGPAWTSGGPPDLEVVITWRPPEEGGLSALPASGRYAKLDGGVIWKPQKRKCDG